MTPENILRAMTMACSRIMITTTRYTCVYTQINQYVFPLRIERWAALMWNMVLRSYTCTVITVHCSGVCVQCICMCEHVLVFNAANC